ncbi:unnamed protein product [Gordionus sp. m RMFG-2023]|uniref:uncharacterized oxidoreductase YjmC-like n=1 Tax=Gordionus sp. m RMFG-2023 TaxID=3053472 RepID=UPI0030E46154
MASNIYLNGSTNGDISKSVVKEKESNQFKLIGKNEIHDFIIDCMTSVGTSEKHSKALADLLYTADYRGHFSHGINRLFNYVEDVSSGACNKDGEPIILNETQSIAWIDGNNLLGPVVGLYCMSLAIEKALNTGIGYVTCKNSNHFGIAGFYSLLASNRGLIGIVCSNTSPCNVPTRGKDIVIGSNPLSVNAPGLFGDYFSLDMATSVVAFGKVEMNQMMGLDIPKGWGVDSKGEPTCKHDKILKGGAMLPLGGEEITGGYKGYGLAMMAEIMSGIVSGSDYGPHVKKWTDKSRPANLGHSFLVINPNMFAPNFEDRMSDLMDNLRNSNSLEEQHRVIVPGDLARSHMKEADKQMGVKYHTNQISSLNSLADKIGVNKIKCAL